MTGLPIPALLLLFTLASVAVSGQQASVVRVCVVGRDTVRTPPIAQQLNSNPEARNQRDLIVKYINHQKSQPNSPVSIEAVALKSTSLASVASDANAAGCTYLVTAVCTPTRMAETDPRNSHAEPSDLSGQGLPPPAPLNFSIMRREPAGWWNGLADSSYSSSKWFAKDVADEVYATILRNP